MLKKKLNLNLLLISDLCLKKHKICFSLKTQFLGKQPVGLKLWSTWSASIENTSHWLAKKKENALSAWFACSNQMSDVDSRDSCSACIESFCLNNFSPLRKVDRRASVPALCS